MKKAPPKHAPLTQFPIQDGQLIVGGVPIMQLAQRVGQTPFYAYDRRLLTQRMSKLRTYLPKGISIHYAIKANPMPALVQHMASIVDGFDLASVAEMQVALDTPMPSKEISFAGPGKQPNELRCAIAAGVTIHLESTTELHHTIELGNTLGIQPKVALRVNPDFELKSSGMKMSGGAKQFGIDAEQIPQVITQLRSSGVEFRGFHIFSGSQNLKPEAIMEAQLKTFELAYRLTDSLDIPLQLLNIGGGFGIPYFPGEQALDLRPIGDQLNDLLPQVRERLGKVEIVIELGRYLVGEAGLYVCRVIDRKISRGEVFLVTDGGLHHHLAASGNFGQVIRKNYPVAIANRMADDPQHTANVVGPLCTPLDLLADKMPLPDAQIGDLVAVYQSGAYGYTASPLNFLSHPPPKEVLV